MKKSVLTVTLNPAIDLHLEVGRWDEREPMRAVAARRAAGGKGVNVARVLKELGVGATAAVALGGIDAGVYRELAKELKLEMMEIEAGGSTRTNVTVRAGARRFKINQSGEAWSTKEWKRAKGLLREAMRGREWVVIAGGLPRGLDREAYGELAVMANRAGARIAVDCRGEALLGALMARVDLVHVNRAELGETLGIGMRGLKSRRAVVDAARELCARGAALVAVTDGAGEAVLVDAKNIWHEIPPGVEQANAVGAGDAFLAGAIGTLCDKKGLREVLSFAVECGSRWTGRNSKTTTKKQPII